MTKHIFEASLNGIGEFHRTSIFPISIMQYKQGVNANPEDPNYDMKQLALKSMSKRIYPNWVNGDCSIWHEDENNIDTMACTMGCRTMIGYDRHGLEYSKVGRGNNNPITIILPKLGIEYGICLGKRNEPDIEGFWKALDEQLKLVENAHLERFAIMIQHHPSVAPFMYQNGTIAGAEECIESVYNSLKHNTFAFGFIGLAETCEAMFGKNFVHDQDVYKFAIDVVKRIADYAKDFSERNNLNGGCYATPAESLCGTAKNKLFEQYGSIPNVTDREYLTNSFHVPVWEKVSIYDKLRIESAFVPYCTAGQIYYIELESTFLNNTKAVEDIIDYAFKELDIPYLAFNFPLDTCMDCGYQGEIGNACPDCGNTDEQEGIERLRRVTGYITTDYRKFNKAKRKEVEERVKHSAYTKFE